MRISSSRTASNPARLVFVDGLRGVAALMVVLYHFHENLLPAVEAWFPPLLSALLLHGDLGVEVFFVLSGFVIAHSIRDAERSWRYFGRFALRRSIRLDPPLWATILLEIVLIRAVLALVPDLGTPIPGWTQILANVTYTQHLLGAGDIVPVFWSLTYEVQFYAVLVGSLVVLSAFSGPRGWVEWLFGLVFLYSLGIWLGAFPLPLKGLFIERWFQFALGIAAWAVFTGRLDRVRFAILCAVTLSAVAVLTPPEVRSSSTLAAVAASALLVAVAAMRKMEVYLRSPATQFLGRVSYSLYLIHLAIGWRFISMVKQAFGPELGPWLGSAAFLGGVALSVLAAWTMHALVEAPSMRLARRIHLPQRPPVADGSPAPPVARPPALPAPATA